MDERPASQAVQLRLDGFEGPLDLLLELARRQRVDLARISIAMLVDQYLDAVTRAERTDLIQAADWLVMAAWLAWLKSRLLLPADPGDAGQAEQARHVLTRRLVELERVRAAADWLQGQPQLGRDMFERGYREPGAVVPAATAVMLMQACLSVSRRAAAPAAPVYGLRRILGWTPVQAILRIRRLLAGHPEAADLLDFLPAMPAGLPGRDASLRVAIASTLLAGLELAREGHVALHQQAAFAPIRVEAAPGFATPDPP